MPTPDVLFDLREFENGTGIGRYARELAREIASQTLDSSKKLAFLKSGSGPTWARPSYETESPTISIREQLTVPFRARGIPLLHVPFLNVPMAYTGKLVLTVHDFTLMDFMEAIPNLHGRFYAWFMTQFSIRRADGIIAISEHTRNEITNRFPSASSKTRVIHNGITSEFSATKEPEKVKEAIHSQGISQPYIFSLGSNSPHKNFKTLVEAFQRVHRDHPNVTLLLAGHNVDWETELGDFVRANDTTGQIQLGGYVDESHVQPLYTGAELFTLVSLNEGFGFPPLEAMACRTPCVVSNTSSLPEVTGDAAVHVDPRDAQEIAVGISDVLANEKLAENLVQRGLHQIENFSWKRCASETLEFYCDLLE
jgi:glycosyltransferase involved in cell wall biosynthesis